MDPFWRDSAFWWAMAAAPLCWYLLSVVGLPVNMEHPGFRLIFWSVLVYPILEEIVFRGGIQPALLTKPLFSGTRAGISVANVVTSIVFAALHTISQGPFWSTLIFLPSLVFGAARDRYGGIGAPIVLHMFYNAGFIALFAR